MKKILYISLIAIAFIGASCTERINVKLGSGKQQVVFFGVITNETKAHSISITRSSDYFDEATSVGFSGATVTVDDGEKTIVLTENPSKKGEYLTPADYTGLINHTYKMVAKVNVDGQIKTYTASSLLKAPMTMDSIQVERDNDRKGWNLKLYAYEPPTKDFYMFKAYKNNILLSDTLNEATYTDDILVNGRYSNGFSAYFLTDEKPDEIIKKGDNMSLEIFSITEEFMYFLYDVQLETTPKTPLFSGPSANVRTNITGENAFGFFTAYSSTKKSAVYQGN